MALHEDLAIIDLTARVHLAGAISLVFLEVIRRPVHLGGTKSLVRLVARKNLVLPIVKSGPVHLVVKRKPFRLGATRSLEVRRVPRGMKIRDSSLERPLRKRAVAKVVSNLFYGLYDL